MKYTTIFLLSIFTLTTVSCKKDPKACFNHSGDDLSIAFKANCSEEADSYYWDFGDNSTSEVQNPVHTYSTAGTYIATLKAENKKGSNEVSQTIVIEKVCITCECFEFHYNGPYAPTTETTISTTSYCGSKSEVKDYEELHYTACRPYNSRCTEN